jgi:hypothetical protein
MEQLIEPRIIRKLNRAVRIDKIARETASNRQINALKNSENINIAHFNGEMRKQNSKQGI